MSDWTDATIGDVCEVVAGQSPKGSNYNDTGDGLPFYQGKKQFGDKYIGAPEKWTTQVTREAYSGDILMSVRAPVGPINFSTEQICIGRGLAAIRTSQQIDRNFLFYALLSMQDQIQGNEGAVFASINKRQIESIPLSIPLLPEQERIVAILDEVFAAIATATANAEKNLANARELFESELNRVFSQKGEGWVERKFGDTDLLQIIDGDRGVNYPKKTDFHSYGHCLFLNTKNVRPDGYNFETTMFITEEKDNILRKGKLKRRDVVLTTRGTIGNIAIYNNDVEFEHIRINSGMLILRPNESKILSEYLFEVLRSPFIKKQIAEFTSGAAQPQLPIRTLVQFVLHVPKNLEAQTQIVVALRALSHRVKHMESIYQKKLDSLAELKQSTLHKAFTGKLTADSKAAERTLSEAGL